MSAFLVSDPHFGHKGIVEFNGAHGTKLRPWDNVEEMNEHIVENWNRVVSPADRLYLTGDAVMNKKWLSIFDRLNGRKVLIKGNHDIFPIGEYLKYFEDIRGSHQLGEFILTHIPVHPDSLHRHKAGNIHGHLHDGRVMLNGEIDRRYICISVEHTNYTPIPFDEIEKYR